MLGLTFEFGQPEFFFVVENKRLKIWYVFTIVVLGGIVCLFSIFR